MPEEFYTVIPPLPDTQPQKSTRTTHHRSYVPATWASAGGGSGHPKLSGGYEVDEHGNPIATRGLNRVGQTYSQPNSTLKANRQARAASELAGTVILIGAGGEYEVRGVSGNQYDVTISPLHCDCPDYLRLLEGGQFVAVQCKHIYMVQTRLANALTDPLWYSTTWVAEQAGYSLRAVQEQLQKGIFPATKQAGVWMIDPVTAPAFVAYLLARIVG